MLTLTENASTIVKTITEQTSESDSAGLRFSQADPEAGGLGVAPVEQPEPGDQVVEEGGARVYLEEQAAAVLDDQVLDAVVDQGGSVQFTIAPQAQV
ncbi:MAG: Fe-S cluster assembly protein HesB [Actinomycetota bacterium]|nr:Fe-S cluster assembly protein HesB [Actinomycetota bacterium]